MVACLLRSFKDYFIKTTNYLHKHTSLAYCVLFYDIFVSFLAIPFALYWRVGSEIINYSSVFILKNAIIFGFLASSFYISLNTYQIMWRYLESNSIIKISLSILGTVLCYWPCMQLISLDEKMPGLILLVCFIVLHVLVLGPRFFIYILHNRHRLKLFANPPLLILGTNQDVDVWLKHAFHLLDFPYNPVGIITYKHEEVGSLIHDVPVVATLDDMEYYLRQHPIPNGFIVVLEYSLKSIGKVIRLASHNRLTLLKAPKSFDLMKEPFDEMSLFHLFKEPVLELTKTEKRFFKNKSILICGAGAILYQKLIDILLDIPCKHIHLLDQSAHVLNDLKQKWGHVLDDSCISFHHGSYLDTDFLNLVLKKAKPDIVLTLPFIQPKFFYNDDLIQIVRNHLIAHQTLLCLCETYKVGLVVMLGERNFEGKALCVLEEWRQHFFLTTELFVKRLYIEVENLLGSAYAKTAIIQKYINQGTSILLNHPKETAFFITAHQMTILMLKSVHHMMNNSDLIKNYYFNLNNSMHLYDLAKHMQSSQNVEDEIPFEYTYNDDKISNNNLQKTAMPFIYEKNEVPAILDTIKQKIKNAVENGDPILIEKCINYTLSKK